MNRMQRNQAQLTPEESRRYEMYSVLQTQIDCTITPITNQARVMNEIEHIVLDNLKCKK